MSQYLITMSSDEYGEEIFHYDSLQEANKGFKRLVNSCKESHITDGINRTLRLTEIHRTFSNEENELS